MKARDLKEGMFIDLEPLIDRLFEEGALMADEADELLMSAVFEFAEVEGVEIEETVHGAANIAVIYNNLNNLAVGADWDVEVAPRVGPAADWGDDGHA